MRSSLTDQQEPISTRTLISNHLENIELLSDPCGASAAAPIGDRIWRHLTLALPERKPTISYFLCAVIPNPLRLRIGSRLTRDECLLVLDSSSLKRAA